jgi:hypothetical protein
MILRSPTENENGLAGRVGSINERAGA